MTDELPQPAAPPAARAELQPLYDAALPLDATGAWIRRAIEAMGEQDADGA